MEEAAGAEVVLLQNGLHLEGGADHAFRMGAGDNVTTEKRHTGTMLLSSVEADTYEMVEYDIWADASLTCESSTNCTCFRQDEAIITSGTGLDVCKTNCLENDDCVAIYCEGDPYDSADCRCHEYPLCNATRVAVHDGVTYKKTQPTPPPTPPPTMCSGSTTEGSTNWTQYSSNSIYVDVDTSSCGFSTTPIYVTSMGGGSSSYITTGSTSIYDESETGFRIYIYTTETPDEANSRGWHINWVAHPVGRLSDSSDASCAGQTASASTNWTQYNTDGIYVDVDTSSCGFSATPVYVTSMGGSGHFWSTGSSEVYVNTATGFRTYIYMSGITPASANSKNWQINWVAQPSGQQDHGDGISCAGESGSTSWEEYSSNAVYVDVDTSSCGFSNTPEYITSMSGSNHWKTTGSSEPYKETESGFRIYILKDDVNTSLASGWNWNVKWIADQA
jgi:hypothetical protein